MSLRKVFTKQAVIAAIVALWVPAVAAGLNVLWKYSTSPGQAAAPPPYWPGRASAQRIAGRPTLLLFAHPQCPCTRASLGELAILMAHAGGQIDAQVFFYRPAYETSGWVKTDLWQAANQIPGVRVAEDPGAAIAKRFGAFTSGQTLLYDARGRLLFHGGITAARGESGDNQGRATIAALLQGNTPIASSLPLVTPVFGCSLREE